MARRKLEEQRVPPIPMTPMIDVVFQLLIFFMLTMHFKEVEGILRTMLPKDKGLQSSSVLNPELQEIRVIICAGGDTRKHMHDKGSHEKVDKDNSRCTLLVEQNEIGELFLTAKHPDRVDQNKTLYKNAGMKIKELYDLTPSTRDASKRAPVIIDADSETPYEHVIGIVNICKEHKIENLEFAGNPRFDLYYGSKQRGQFTREPR
ncbi:MAG: biopolymer transporter ExbD [Planctomycetes bacterium]|nr:biopolymer transporter ExbD [Planctomycetota bacterium]